MSNVRCRSRAARAVVALLACFGSASVLALTFPVTNTADSGPGSLRQAVLDANGSGGADQIDITVAGAITLTTGELVISESVTINGPGARSLAISGNDASRIFRLDNAQAKDVVISGLTLTDGGASGNGGAILNQGGNLTLRAMRIVNNTATGEGGAIYNSFFDAGNVLTIEDSEISNNDANKNGAFYFIGFELRMSNSTIHGNQATDSVGAFLMQFASGYVRNSTITGNAANFVGGVQVQDSSVTFESTILAGNTDSTGLNDINRTGSGTTNATNSLFEEDVAATSVINGTNVGNLIATPPDLGALANNGGPTDSRRPNATSQVIGAGSNSVAYVFDQRGTGFPRDAGGTVDIGAIQRALPAPPAPSVPVPGPGGLALGLLALLLAAFGARRLRR